MQKNVRYEIEIFSNFIQERLLWFSKEKSIKLEVVQFFMRCSNSEIFLEIFTGSRLRCSIARVERPFLKYDFKAQKIARIICHYVPCCPREGINPRELMPPFTILAPSQLILRF